MQAAAAKVGKLRVELAHQFAEGAILAPENRIDLRHIALERQTERVACLQQGIVHRAPLLIVIIKVLAGGTFKDPVDDTQGRLDPLQAPVVEDQAGEVRTTGGEEDGLALLLVGQRLNHLGSPAE